MTMAKAGESQTRAPGQIGEHGRPPPLTLAPMAIRFFLPVAVSHGRCEDFAFGGGGGGG
jgi:hypothetical protein